MVSVYEIPPMKAAYPYHFHHNNEETFYIISGEGILRTPNGEREVGAGDLLFFPGHVAVSLGEGRFVHATAYPGCGCVTVNSLNEKDPDYRRDLREKLIAVGSIFPQR